MSNLVDDFLAKLAANAPKEKKEFEEQSNRTIEKIYLNFPGNFGRYQIFPMNSVIEDNFPFVTLFGTREVCIPRKITDQNGNEQVINPWIKILPKNAYKMKDMTGRVVSSLTASDESLLNQAYLLWDQLYNEVDARNSLEIQKTLVRRKNYTIFHGMCLNKWEPNQSRNSSRQNFCALFVCTAKSFLNCIEDNIREKSLLNGGDTSWVREIYNRDLSGRTGFLMFSVNTKKDGSAGFAITTTHEAGNSSFSNISIDPDDAALMSDPVATFLGYQANKDDQNQVGYKRLFNPIIIQEAIQYMTEQLSAIRAAKNLGGIDIKDVIKKTSDDILAKQPVRTTHQVTNDPVLAGMENNQSNFGQTTVVNPEAIRTGNTDPFASAPVYHADPVTGAPVGTGNTQQPIWGNNNPGFAQPTGQSAPFNPNLDLNVGNGKDDLPF